MPFCKCDEVLPYKFESRVVPCGKCFECLKNRQNDIVVRTCIEAEKRGSMHLVTLTYEDDDLPLSFFIEAIDKVTGEVFVDRNSYVLDKKQFSDIYRKYIPIFKEKVKSTYACFIELDLKESLPLINDLPDFDDNYEYHYYLTPSLRRRDVRYWLKRARVKYLRTFGQPLPEFSYIFQGEFGPKTVRPHYHCLFLGLNDDQVQFLCDWWKLGFYNWKRVRRVNKDGTNGFQICARYVSKYLCKYDLFKSNSEIQGKVEKPRLCVSQSYGYDGSDSVLSYYCGYDLLGKYDLNKIQNFTDSQVDYLSYLVNYRNSYDLGGYSYKIPKYLVRKYFYRKGYGSKQVPTALQIVRSSFIQANFLDLCIGECELSEEQRQVVSKLNRESEVSSLVNAQAKEKAFIKDCANKLSKSIY